MSVRSVVRCGSPEAVGGCSYGGRVPRLSEFYGIVIYMYWEDHAPPHFHAIYAGHEALVRVDDGSFIRGALPRTAHKLVLEWREMHVDELLENWHLAQQPTTLLPIEPLR